MRTFYISSSNRGSAVYRRSSNQTSSEDAYDASTPKERDREDSGAGTGRGNNSGNVLKESQMDPISNQVRRLGEYQSS